MSVRAEDKPWDTQSAQNTGTVTPDITKYSTEIVFNVWLMEGDLLAAILGVSHITQATKDAPSLSADDTGTLSELNSCLPTPPLHQGGLANVLG